MEVLSVLWSESLTFCLYQLVNKIYYHWHHKVVAVAELIYRYLLWFLFHVAHGLKHVLVWSSAHVEVSAVLEREPRGLALGSELGSDKPSDELQFLRLEWPAENSIQQDQLECLRKGVIVLL